MTKLTPEQVNEKFCDIVLKRSDGGLLGLSRNFRIIDRDGDKTLSFQEFKVAMTKFRIGLTPEETKMLFEFYDKDGGGTIDFNEFLKGLRSKLSPMRRALVEQAFIKMDRDGSGKVDYKDLIDHYDLSYHPRVQAGDWTKKQAIEEFLKVFEGDEGNGDGVVTKQEFTDYYVGVSSNIDEDDEFGILMAHNWGIDYVPKRDADQLLHMIKSKAEQKASGNPKRAAQQIFKFFDTDNSKTIDFKEFCQAMEQFGANFNDKQARTMFRYFDKDESGVISYEELIGAVWKK